MDGITNRYHTPFLVDLVNKGSSLIPDFWIPVPERFFVPGVREHAYVPGSQKATINVAGKVDNNYRSAIYYHLCCIKESKPLSISILWLFVLWWLHKILKIKTQSKTQFTIYNF